MLPVAVEEFLGGHISRRGIAELRVSLLFNITKFCWINSKMATIFSLPTVNENF